MHSKFDDLDNSLRLATVVEALCRVASLGRAVRRCEVSTHHLGAAIEGGAAVALQEILAGTIGLPGGAARRIEARIRSSLGHGDRALLGTVYARGVVDSARRRMVE